MPDVPVRCCQAAVAQLCLDHMQWVSLVGELKGVRVPQAMGVDPALDPSFPRQTRQQRPDVAALEWLAIKCAEQVPLCTKSEFRTLVEPALQDGPGSLIERASTSISECQARSWRSSQLGRMT